MPSALTAFLGGAAEQATKMIETEKKNAREIAAAQASAMLKNYMEVDKQAKDLSSKMSADVEFLKGYYPDVSDDDLVEAAKNPEAMAVFKKKASEPDFDSRVIKFNDFVTVASKTSGKDFKTQINELYDIRKLEAAPTQAAENFSFFQRIAAGEGEAELKRLVAPFGVTPEQLRGAMSYKPSVTSAAKFNLNALSTKTFAQEEDKAKLDVVAAQALPKDDPNRDAALVAATTKLSQFTVVKSLVSTEGLTNEKILSNLVTQIQELPKDSPKRKELESQVEERKKLMSSKETKVTENDIRTDLATRIIEAKKNNKTQEATALTAELKQREALLDKAETDPNKISAASYQTAANRAIASAIATYVPAGDFNVVTDPNGNQTVTLKNLTKTADYDKGLNAGRLAVLKEYTNENGVPKSEEHKLALIAIGVVFDSRGVASVPAARTGAPPPAPAPAAPAPAPAAPKPAAAPAPKPLPSRTKTATMADVNAFAAKQKLTPAQVKADLEKNGYKIVD
jgi:hypothetical protein